MTQKTREFINGSLSLLTAAFLFSTFGALAKIVAFDIPLFYQSVVRSLMLSIGLGIWIYLSKQWKQPSQKDIAWIIARSVGGCIGYALMYQGLYALTIGTTYFITYAGTIIGSFIAGYLLFKEKMSPFKILCFFLAILGLYIIYYDTLKFNSPYFVFIDIIAGFGYAAWFTFSKKISHLYPTIQLNFLDTFFGLIFMLILSIATREQWTIPTLTKPWIVSLLYGLVSITASQLIIIGFKRVEAQIGSIITLSEIVFAMILGVVFFKESVTTMALIGGFLVVTAIALPEIRGILVRNKEV